MVTLVSSAYIGRNWSNSACVTSDRCEGKYIVLLLPNWSGKERKSFFSEPVTEQCLGKTIYSKADKGRYNSDYLRPSFRFPPRDTSDYVSNNSQHTLRFNFIPVQFSFSNILYSSSVSYTRFNVQAQINKPLKMKQG